MSRTAFWGYWICALLLCGLMIPMYSMPGEFFDGMNYAILSRNMAIGQGSFWKPHWMSFLPSFHEHPPLALGLGALYFRLFDDHWWVEKLFSASCLLLTMVLLRAIWKTITDDVPQAHGRAWLPLLAWLLCPSVSWVFLNNMLEAVIMPFALGAVLLQLHAFRASGAELWRLAGLAGLLLWGAFLVKGPVGVFPLTSALLLGATGWRHAGGFRKSCAITAIQGGMFALVAALTLLNTEAREALAQWIQQQLLPSLNGGRSDGHPPSEFALALPKQLVWPAVALAFWAVLRGVSAPAGPLPARALGMGLVALSASLPIAGATRFSAYYITPSLAFYSLAFAMFACAVRRPATAPPDTPALTGRPAWRWISLLVLPCALVIGMVLANQYPSRGSRRYVAATQFLKALPTDSPIGLWNPAREIDFELISMAARSHRIELDWLAESRESRRYMLAREPLPPGWCRSDVTFESYVLWKKCAQ